MEGEKGGGIARFASQNISGITLKDGGGDCRAMREEIIGYQVGCLCLQEHKLCHKSRPVQEIARRAVRSHFGHSRCAFSPSGRACATGLAKGHQPAGKKAGVQGQAQGLSQMAKDALARALGMPAAPQA